MQKFKKLLPVFNFHCNCCVCGSDALSSGRLLSKTNSQKKHLSRSSRHSNNSIIDLPGLHQTLSHSGLGWLNLSFNKLKHTDTVRRFFSHMFACALPLFLLVVFFFPLFFSLTDHSLIVSNVSLSIFILYIFTLYLCFSVYVSPPKVL